jgi:hypothetical protein
MTILKIHRIYLCCLLMVTGVALVALTGCQKATVVTYASLSTTQITNIKSVSATCGGTITSDGGSKITESGICWSLSSNPTVSGYKSINTVLKGSFISPLTDLIPDTTYYVRSYAMNSFGISYGYVVHFITLPVAQLTTVVPTYITSTTAVSGGDIITDFGTEITSRGVCWSTNPLPKVKNNYTVDGSGVGTYVSKLKGLIPSTKYYLRAYATNQGGIVYGDTISFKTLDQ